MEHDSLYVWLFTNQTNFIFMKFWAKIQVTNRDKQETVMLFWFERSSRCIWSTKVIDSFTTLLQLKIKIFLEIRKKNWSFYCRMNLKFWRFQRWKLSAVSLSNIQSKLWVDYYIGSNILFIAPFHIKILGAICVFL